MPVRERLAAALVAVVAGMNLCAACAGPRGSEDGASPADGASATDVADASMDDANTVVSFAAVYAGDSGRIDGLGVRARHGRVEPGVDRHRLAHGGRSRRPLEHQPRAGGLPRRELHAGRAGQLRGHAELRTRAPDHRRHGLQRERVTIQQRRRRFPDRRQPRCVRDRDRRSHGRPRTAQ